VGVAVIGCGYWGPNLIRNFSALGRSDLRAVCDLDPARLARVQGRYPAVAVHQDLARVLDDPAIEAVAVCTPVHTHFPIASAALEAGKHVLVEKPLTHSSETARALIDLAAARERVLMVDHTFVYNGAVRKIRSLIDEGQLGEILYFDSVRISLGIFQDDINVVWDLAAHDLSIMDYLLRRDPLWVSAVGSTHFGKLENLAYLTIKFDDRLIGHVHVNWLAPVKLRSTLIGGSKRMIVYDDLSPSEKIRVYDKGVTLDGDPLSRTQALIDYRVGDMFAPHSDRTEPLESVCNAFLDAILLGKTPPSDGPAGLRAVRMLEAAQHSIERSGDRVTLQ
jgi:predicted dehydrogenase